MVRSSRSLSTDALNRIRCTFFAVGRRFAPQLSTQVAPSLLEAGKPGGITPGERHAISTKPQHSVAWKSLRNTSASTNVQKSGSKAHFWCVFAIIKPLRPDNVGRLDSWIVTVPAAGSSTGSTAGSSPSRQPDRQPTRQQSPSCPQTKSGAPEGAPRHARDVLAEAYPSAKMGAATCFLRLSTPGIHTPPGTSTEMPNALSMSAQSPSQMKVEPSSMMSVTISKKLR